MWPCVVTYPLIWAVSSQKGHTDKSMTGTTEPVVSEKANYSNPSATTCNLSVALHVIRELMPPLPPDTGDEVVRTIAESFVEYSAGGQEEKRALPLVDYDQHGTPHAPLLPSWDPSRYQDAHECLTMLLERIETGLAGTPHAALVSQTLEGAREKTLCRECGHDSAPKREAFRCVEVGGGGLQTSVADLFNAYWSKRTIDFGAPTIDCSHCNKCVSGSETYTLLRAPETLVTKLSRSGDDDGDLTGSIAIDEGLSVAGTEFTLSAVIVKKGSHYYAYTCSGGGAFKFDDMAPSWCAQRVSAPEWKSRLEALAGDANEQATTLVYQRAACQTLRSQVQRAACETLRSQLRSQVETAMGLKIDRWPAHYRKAADAPLLGHHGAKYDSGSGRHDLLRFCFHNGCPPDLFLKWLDARNCLNSDTRSYFSSAVIRLGDGKECGKTWDIKKRKSVVAVMPESVRDSVPAALEVARSLASGKDGCGAATEAPCGCKAYYAQNGGFPAEHVSRLLHRNGSPFQMREVSINSKVLRSQPVLSFRKLGEMACLVNTVALHAGPAFDYDSQEIRLTGALGTEMVLEIDDLPGGIPESERWKWLHHAVTVTLHVLREWHGVEKVRSTARRDGERTP